MEYTKEELEIIGHLDIDTLTDPGVEKQLSELQKLGLYAREYREWVLDMNQTDFAKEIGITRQTLAAIENGNGGGVGIKTWLKIWSIMKTKKTTIEATRSKVKVSRRIAKAVEADYKKNERHFR